MIMISLFPFYLHNGWNYEFWGDGSLACGTTRCCKGAQFRPADAE